MEEAYLGRKGTVRQSLCRETRKGFRKTERQVGLGEQAVAGGKNWSRRSGERYEGIGKWENHRNSDTMELKTFDELGGGRGGGGVHRKACHILAL